MKTNKKPQYLNVYKYGYRYPKMVHPFYNIKQFFKNIRKAHQRATKGFCDEDLYEWNSFILILLENSLKDFDRINQEKQISCPDSGDYVTMESWHNFILTLVDKLHNCNCNYPEVSSNKYAEDYYTYFNDAFNKYKNVPVDDPEFKKIKQKFDDEEKNVKERQIANAKEAIKLIYENFYNMWL